MAEAALDYDQLLDQPPLEIPAGGIANFITATTGSWADEEDIPRSGIAEVKKVADKLAEYGRLEDEYMVHAAEGETVIPMAVFRENPRLKEKLFEQMRMMGIDPERYVVGNELNSINPVTGQPEFFLKKLWRGVKKVFKKVIHVVLPVMLNAMTGGALGLIGSAALGSGIITLTQGGSFGDALKSAAMGGAAAGLFKGIQGGIRGARAGEGFGTGFREGLVEGLPSGARGRMQARQEGRAILNPEEIPVEEVNVAGDPVKSLPGSPDPSQTVFDGPYDDDAYKQQLFTEARSPVDTSVDYTGRPYLMDSPKSDVVSTDATVDLTPKQTAGAQQRPVTKGGGGVDSLRPPGFLDSIKDVYTPDGEGPLGALRNAFFPRGPSWEALAEAQYPGVDPYTLKYSIRRGLQKRAQHMAPGMMRQFAPLLGTTMAIDALTKDDEIEVDMDSPWGGETGWDLFNKDPDKYMVRFPLPAYGTMPYPTDRAHGGSIDAMDFPPRIGAIYGPGTETSDDVPAMLSDGEFVMTAEAVRGAGNGNRQAGMNNMYNLMRNFERVA